MKKLPILPCAEKRASFVYRTAETEPNQTLPKRRK